MTTTLDPISPAPSRIGVKDGTMTLHFRSGDALDKAANLVPAGLDQHELTMIDRASAMPRLFLPILPGHDYTAMFQRMQLSSAAIEAVSPHVQQALAALSPQAQALAAVANLPIRGGEHFDAGHAASPASTSAEPTNTRDHQR